MSALAKLRSLWLDVHLWIGAGLLIALMPLAVSGSVLVWHDQIDHALYASRYATTEGKASLPVSAYADAAQKAFGDRAQLTQVRLPGKPGDPVVAVGRMNVEVPQGGRPRTLNAWLNPPDAKVLDTAEVNAQFTMVLHRLHGNLLIPEVGRKVVGWLGWAMFISCATGLWLWWPRRGGFLLGLRWTRGDSQLFNLHHLIGFWVCVPLAVLSLTGVYISFPQTSRALFGLPPPPPRAANRFAPPIAQPQLGVDQAVATALASAPGGQVTEVNAPTKGKDPAWRVSVKAPGAERPKTVQVVDATGEIRKGRGGDGGGGGGPDPTSRLMRQIHDGNDMGLVWRLIITLGGLAPAVLGVTGVVMWLRREARKRRLNEPAVA